MNLLGKMRSFTPTARANMQWRFKIARGKTGNEYKDFSMRKGNPMHGFNMPSYWMFQQNALHLQCNYHIIITPACKHSKRFHSMIR